MSVETALKILLKNVKINKIYCRRLWALIKKGEQVYFVGVELWIRAGFFNQNITAKKSGNWIIIRNLVGRIRVKEFSPNNGFFTKIVDNLGSFL